MKKVLASSLALISAGLISCADSGQQSQEMGAPASTETESSSTTTITNEDPGVAQESGTAGSARNESAESRFNTIGSVSAPSATVPPNMATNAPAGDSSESGSAGNSPATSGNEQGAQASPEPQTGDDANPDQIKPEAN